MTHPLLPYPLSFEEPVILLHSEWLLYGANYSLDDLFFDTQQWTQSGLPPQGHYLEIIRGMRDLNALLQQLQTYRLGIIVSHPVDYVRELYQMPGIAPTVDFDHITQHYYASHETINPTRIVPTGPAIDWWAPHGRARLSAA